MRAPGSSAKRSSSSLKGRPRSLSIASNILRSSSLSNWRAARGRGGLSGGVPSQGWSPRSPLRWWELNHHMNVERRPSVILLGGADLGGNIESMSCGFLPPLQLLPAFPSGVSTKERDEKNSCFSSLSLRNKSTSLSLEFPAMTRSRT
jgi:hypothetical protein